MIAALAGQPVLAKTPLPQKTDIPADYGGAAICPNVETTLAFLRNHHVANSYGNLDSTIYLEGRKLSGCRDADRPLEIVEVLERRAIGADTDGPYIAFRARTASGLLVTGVVGEGGNNRHPRTPTERWLRLHAPNGVVEIAKGSGTAYACPTVAAARAAVKAIPPVRKRGANNPHQVTAFRAALKQHKCRAAAGRFNVVGVGNSAFISLGYEAGQDWTALHVTDARLQPAGLVFDASLM
jgi:hypothetical protein